MSQTWNVVVALDPDSKTPIFLQIARAISEAIQLGKLSPGEALPGTRVMADVLKVHRKTIVAAYDELTAQGWIQAEPSKRTFVSSTFPKLPQKGMNRAYQMELPEFPSYSFQMASTSDSSYAPVPKDVLVFNDGTPDPRLLPTNNLIRAYRKVLTHHKSSLNYGDPRGQPTLRVELADMLNKVRGLACKPDEVLITRGSQMALYLAAQTLIRTGDIVAIEELSYPPAWQAFEHAGAEILPIPLDEDGLSVEFLEAISQKKQLRAVYLTPHHQYPTTVSLPACRRMKLLELAKDHGFVIIEDDYDHEYHYLGHPILPLASVNHTGNVLYVGSLSKLLTPDLRIGYIVAPKALVDSMAALRLLIDRQGDPVLEQTVAELMNSGELNRHAKKARKQYQLRRDYLVKRLMQLEDNVNLTIPSGGLALWLQFPKVNDMRQLAEYLQKHGVIISPAEQFAYQTTSMSAARLGFAALNPEEIEQGITVLEKSIKVVI